MDFSSFDFARLDDATEVHDSARSTCHICVPRYFSVKTCGQWFTVASRRLSYYRAHGVDAAAVDYACGESFCVNPEHLRARIGYVHLPAYRVPPSRNLSRTAHLLAAGVDPVTYRYPGSTLPGLGA